MTEKAYPRLYLDEYKPNCELRVEQHEVTRPKFPIIDMHTHFGPMVLGQDYASKYDTGEEVAQLKEVGVRKVVTLERCWDDNFSRLMEKIHPYEDFITAFGSVDYSKLDEQDFESMVWRTVRDLKARGAKGLKIWKDLNFYIKDSRDQYIPVDDKRLKCIWQTSAELNMPIVIHIADPVAFFRPVDRLNEGYECLMASPEWAFSKPGMFSFEQLMEQQEHLVEDNPKTTFVIAHVGSCGEDLGFVARCLDKYPNMHIDIAARLNQIGRQPYTARKFFEKYADRILFGTDYVPGDGAKRMFALHFRFLETFDEYFEHPYADLGRWHIYGIELPNDILEKVYYHNSERILGL